MNHPHRLARSSLALACLCLGFVTARAQEAPKPEAVRAAFHQIIDRPRVDLAPQQTQDAAADGFVTTHFSYASDASQRIPGILTARPGTLADGQRHPAVIVMHGTGGKKEGEAGRLRQFADKGFVAVAIDGRYHGERGSLDDYYAAIAAAFKDNADVGRPAAHPLYFDTVWDATRLIDYLQTRPEVDGQRIGLMGISKGGIETYLTAAVDPRIAAAAPCIGVQSFRWALEHDGWHGRVGTFRKAFDAAAKSAGVEHPDAAFVRTFYDRLIPGIADRFDGPVMMGLIAPRPLLVINGDQDDKTPLESVKLCGAAAKAAYEAAGAADHFQQIIEPNTGHAVTAESSRAALAFFEHWLKP